MPGIRRLAGERLPVNLAVSLHAANDALRERAGADQPALPAGRRWSRPASDYLAAKGRRLSFEWALIDGVNDRPVRRRRAGRPSPAACGPTSTSSPSTPRPATRPGARRPPGVRAFRDRLVDLGVNATVRRNRGTDIDAACGQLAGGRGRWLKCG